LYFDAARIFKTDFEFNRFQHRLDHDPLANLDAGQLPHLAAWGTDLAPGHEYRITYTDIHSKSELNIPDASWLKFRVEFRRETRDGAHQGFALSKCSSCHVNSMARPVDEATNTIKGSVIVDTGKFGAEYSFLYRSSTEDEKSVLNLYDSAIHPVLLADVFTNRVLYDDTNGPLPTNYEPDTSKRQHTFKLHYNFDENTKLAGAAIYSDEKNDDADLHVYSRNYSARFSRIFKNNISFNTRFRYSNIDNVSTYVHLVEQPAVAGPQAGMTYTDAYPEFGTADFVRFSALSRQTYYFDADATIPFANRDRLMLMYNYKGIDRDYFSGDTTKKHTFPTAFRTNPMKPFSARIRYRFQKTSDPFTNFKAAIAPALQPQPTPGGSPFIGTQYWVIYENRQANLTNQPTISHDLNFMGTWKSKSSLGINFNYNYKYQKNDDLNFSDWSQTIHILGANIWYNPAERVMFNAGVNYNHYKTEALFSQPVWDG